ncbi:MAG TPA: hypothetical protein P5077_06370 [bacterium]|nr:hypothetical protein [bacterium]
MTRSLTLALMLLASGILAADDLFDAYTGGDHAAAADILQDRLTERPHDPLLHYNLGVVEERRGNRGAAVHHYLQALQAAPAFPEARNNLDLLTAELHVTVPKQLTEPSSGLAAVAAPFFLFLYLFVFALIRHLFRPAWKLRLALIPLFMFTVLFATLFVMRYRAAGMPVYAVALSAGEMRSGPDAALTAVGKVKEGEVLEIAATSDGWAKTKSFQDNIEGWLPASRIHHLTRRVE